MTNEARWPKIMRCIFGLSQESLKGYNHIDCLCDELLTEILLRLPTFKSVIQCKCVCKRWAALASHPDFKVQFIGLKLGYLNNGGLDLNKEHTFAFVMQYKPDRICWKGLESESFFRPSIFDAQKSSFSPLHSCLGDDNASVSDALFASCRNLLLYYKYENTKYDCYISNVQTMQSVVLPSSPYYFQKVFLVGFICDTFFSCDKEVVINVAYHYSVLLVHCTPRPSNKFSAHVFSSHCDRQWCNRVLSLPKICRPIGPGPFAFSFCFDGKLHFSCCEGFFGFEHNKLAFDNDEIQCHLVEWPAGMLPYGFRVGVSQENLYVSDYCCDTATLRVWVLKDYKEGTWMLQHRVETREWVSRDFRIVKKLKKFKHHLRVLGFHPSSSDVIYVVVPGLIYLCNLSTKMVELACAIPVAKKRKNHLNKFYAFPVLFQSLPTPLPPLAQSL